MDKRQQMVRILRYRQRPDSIILRVMGGYKYEY